MVLFRGRGLEKMGMLYKSRHLQGRAVGGVYKLHGVVNMSGKNVAVFRCKVTYQHIGYEYKVNSR